MKLKTVRHILGYGGKYLFETVSFTHVINTCFKRVSNPGAHERGETARDMYDIYISNYIHAASRHKFFKFLCESDDGRSWTDDGRRTCALRHLTMTSEDRNTKQAPSTCNISQWLARLSPYQISTRLRL